MQGAIKRDAHEFGLHVRQGGWRLGLLVARNVQKGQGRRNDLDNLSHARKVTAAEFARLSGTSADRVLRHLLAWNNAADAGHVPHGDTLSPGADDVRLDVDTLPDWSEFYPPQYADRMRRAGQQAARERPEQIVEALRHAPEAAATIVTQVLEDDDVRAAVAASPKGVATAHALQRATQRRHAIPPRVVDPLPQPPAFAGAFWRAVSAVDAAVVELDRFGVRGVDARPETRAAAERLASHAARLRTAVAEYVADNIEVEESQS